MLLEDGTPVHIVSAMLGHSKPSITLDVYSHAAEGGSEQAGQRLTAGRAQHVESGNRPVRLRPDYPPADAHAHDIVASKGVLSAPSPRVTRP
jgi:hypothetical protein